MPAYSSSEAAQMLSIAPITLRKLCTAFAAWLSPSAGGATVADAPWDRSYNDDDLDTLRYIIILLKQKRSYAWVRERLTVEFGVGDLVHSTDEPEPETEQLEIAVGQAAPSPAEAEVIETEPSMSSETPTTDHADRAAPRAQADDAPHVVEAEVLEPETHVPPDITAMLARMADLYQELLRNKEQEITALRQALDVTELSAANERRELEMLSRLTKIMERENQRLTAELEHAQRQLGQSPPKRGLLARIFGGGEEDAGAASHSQISG